MSSWDALSAELDAWRRAGKTANFWWRDDDAAAPTPALNRLLELRARAGIPLAIATVPGKAEPGLVKRMAGEKGTALLQHGWMHANHAPAGDGKAELGDHRALAIVLADIAQGRRQMDRLFGDLWLPILVPPYNRIAPSIVRGLPGLGFYGLSTFKPRATREAMPGLIQINTHIDIIDWHGTRGFVGEKAAIALAIDHLAARRSGDVDAEEPTGLLTHHLAHDEGCWKFIADFATHTKKSPATRWLAAGEAFAPAQIPARA